MKSIRFIKLWVMNYEYEALIGENDGKTIILMIAGMIVSFSTIPFFAQQHLMTSAVANNSQCQSKCNTQNSRHKDKRKTYCVIMT